MLVTVAPKSELQLTTSKGNNGRFLKIVCSALFLATGHQPARYNGFLLEKNASIYFFKAPTSHFDFDVSAYPT